MTTEIKMQAPICPQLAPQRVRHPLKARLLQVRKITCLTPRMVRVTFHGRDLGDFISASFDDHMKLFFPPDGQPIVPTNTPEGPRFAEGTVRPPARDYTPRYYREATRELDIDFVLHGDGPAASWVAGATEGDELVVAGPRGSFVMTPNFDWQLMIGDETALPAIGRRLEELPAAAKAYVIALVENAAEEQAFQTQAQVNITWLHREGSSESEQALVNAVRTFALPAGEGYIWGAGQAAHMRAISQYLLEEKGIDKSRVRISNYWKPGSPQE
ncbi:siderophore-interacting protein [Advenella sp. S44]|uniref:siderophore-interacting protein n=1 Tax=Advenella sp. S44 TaxID=1982755 RepID=UPI001F5B6AF3|nr:siderophore-interacting protein [Advenella sp. S44]